MTSEIVESAAVSIEYFLYQLDPDIKRLVRRYERLRLKIKKKQTIYVFIYIYIYSVVSYDNFFWSAFRFVGRA